MHTNMRSCIALTVVCNGNKLVHKSISVAKKAEEFNLHRFFFFFFNGVKFSPLRTNKVTGIKALAEVIIKCNL